MKKKRSIPSHIVNAVALVNNYMKHNKVFEIRMFEIWITKAIPLCGTKRPKGKEGK